MLLADDDADAGSAVVLLADDDADALLVDTKCFIERIDITPQTYRTEPKLLRSRLNVWNILANTQGNTQQQQQRGHTQTNGVLVQRCIRTTVY